MKILKGKHAGDGYRLHQWANDWISTDSAGGKPVIVGPLNVQLEGDEYWQMRQSYSRFLSGEVNCGLFWRHYELQTDGTFKLAKVAPAVEASK